MPAEIASDTFSVLFILVAATRAMSSGYLPQAVAAEFIRDKTDWIFSVILKTISPSFSYKCKINTPSKCGLIHDLAVIKLL